ncbi:hypothetical protein CTI12_AA273400 [Artemisia annua]|uniref:Uncharacterized protein n=1 Tax=Artemisia annua TaxID=35608 RepID=A0A2U1LUQ2_ARTAN|nr:hypothetical protein CTI12_AA273400 [Artemisia annua]
MPEMSGRLCSTRPVHIWSPANKKVVAGQQFPKGIHGGRLRLATTRTMTEVSLGTEMGVGLKVEIGAEMGVFGVQIMAAWSLQRGPVEASLWKAQIAFIPLTQVVVAAMAAVCLWYYIHAPEPLRDDHPLSVQECIHEDVNALGTLITFTSRDTYTRLEGGLRENAQADGIHQLSSMPKGIFPMSTDMPIVGGSAACKVGFDLPASSDNVQQDLKSTSDIQQISEAVTQSLFTLSTVAIATTTAQNSVPSVVKSVSIKKSAAVMILETRNSCGLRFLKLQLDFTWDRCPDLTMLMFYGVTRPKLRLAGHLGYIELAIPIYRSPVTYHRIKAYSEFDMLKMLKVQKSKENETEVGEALAEAFKTGLVKSEDLFITTKGNCFGQELGCRRCQKGDTAGDTVDEFGWDLGKQTWWHQRSPFNDQKGVFMSSLPESFVEMAKWLTPDVEVYNTDDEVYNTDDIVQEGEVYNTNDVVKEWDEYTKGINTIQRNESKRIEKLPDSLLKREKGRRNREYYKPMMVSFGPYHHGQNDLARAEKYKRITLKEYCRCSPHTIDFVYNKVFEVIHEARKCYIDGSTSNYNDEEFNLMMLRDGCLIMHFIESVAHRNKLFFLTNEYMGAYGFGDIIRDMFLLENQIPFVVLHVLLELRFANEAEEMLKRFFNYLNTRDPLMMNEKILDMKQSIHLLELYRSYFIYLDASYHKSIAEISYALRKRKFTSVMDIKDRGIFVKCNKKESTSKADMEFHSHCCSGELKIVSRAVSDYTKAMYLNMIAYEMCPHTPNDFRVSTYVSIMKSLIVTNDDVKELQRHNIIIHLLSSNEEVVKMYDDIEAPIVNVYMFAKLKGGMMRYRKKTWLTELFTLYFSSPWKVIALLVATAVLFTGFVQTYYTIWPLR